LDYRDRSSGALSVCRAVQPALYAIRLEGELDVGTVELLQHELATGLESACERVLVDLSGLRFIDSTGLWILLEAQSLGEQTGDRVAFLRPRGSALRVLEIAGLDQRLRFVDWPATA
jgi:anti-sigma B factor antagonist